MEMHGDSLAIHCCLAIPCDSLGHILVDYWAFLATSHQMSIKYPRVGPSNLPSNACESAQALRICQHFWQVAGHKSCESAKALLICGEWEAIKAANTAMKCQKAVFLSLFLLLFASICQLSEHFQLICIALWQLRPAYSPLDSRGCKYYKKITIKY